MPASPNRRWLLAALVAAAATHSRVYGVHDSGLGLRVQGVGSLWVKRVAYD